MARSIGNLNDSLAMEGSMSNNYDSPSKRLANTIQMMKKASNPDLTAPEQFEDTGSPFAMRMRGAVQKKMDRYRARNKSGIAGRNQTSEESDSNNSDMTPLNINKRALAAGNRSTTTSDCSPVSSRGSSSLAMNSGRKCDRLDDPKRCISRSAIGSGLSSSRRLYDQQRSGLPSVSTPRRPGNNYLVTKMSEQMNKSMEGPDLGSDESPRSSVNSHEWQNLIENSQDGSRNRKSSDHLIRNHFTLSFPTCRLSSVFHSSSDLPRPRLHGTIANSRRQESPGKEIGWLILSLVIV